uniref:DNA replication complex GINS protein SLD5 n=1 Tax=Romanomermis culicivorax TaxID=13658 RepID=A0A915K8F6_ROMCU
MKEVDDALENNDIIVEGDTDNVQIEPAELLKLFKQVWLNEKMAPELLPHRDDIVCCLLDELNRLDQELMGGHRADLSVSLRKMDIERLRYILADYLRVRTVKIEKFCFSISDRDENSKLSEKEINYLIQYKQDLEEHLKKSAVDNMPGNAKKLKYEQIASQANLHHYVFARVLPEKSVKNLLVDGADEQSEELVDLEENTQHLLPYKYISGNLDDGDVCLM